VECSSVWVNKVKSLNVYWAVKAKHSVEVPTNRCGEWVGSGGRGWLRNRLVP